ncbi:MAG TPA: hypothetical protein VGC66_04000 [Pyrinomonadaceae bacterium]|jgi:hypothetical protein
MLNKATTATDTNTTTVRFPLGRVFLTHGAIEALREAEQPAEGFLGRHARLGACYVTTTTRKICSA